MMMTMRAPAYLFALVALMIVGRAQAERRRARIGVQPIYAFTTVDKRDPSGGGVGVDVALGVTDALSLRATGFVAFHSAGGLTTSAPNGSFATGPGGTTASFGAFAGITYALDVVRIVPSFDLGIGVVGLRGDPRVGTGPVATALLPAVTALAVELGFGADYLVTHTWSVGFVVRYHALLTELEHAPSFLYVGPRVSVSLPF